MIVGECKWEPHGITYSNLPTIFCIAAKNTDKPKPTIPIVVMANTTEVKLTNQPTAKLENTTKPIPILCKLVILDLSSSGTRVCINVPLVVLNAA